MSRAALLALCLVACDDGSTSAAPPDSSAPDADTVDGLVVDAVLLDAATPDAATPDGATHDGATPDGATRDAATLDAATLDAASLDGTTPDGAVDLDAGPPPAPRDLDDPEAWDPWVTPSPAWDEVEPTRMMGGVEFIDPHGALDELDLAVGRADDVEPPEGAWSTWSLEPGGALSAVVIARFPLDPPQAPGRALTMWVYDHDALEWVSESAGRISADGRYGVFAMRHFSHHSLTPAQLARLKFLRGCGCDAEPPTADAATDGGRHDVGCADPDPAAVEPGGHLSRVAGGEGDNAGSIATALTREMAVCGLSDIRDVIATPGLTIKNVDDPQPHHEEDYLMDPGVLRLVRDLATEVRTRSCGATRLRVNDAFDSLREHGGTSLHYEGRAVDITPLTAGGARDAAALGRVTRVAREVGFDWSHYENPSVDVITHHLHASARAVTQIAAIVAQCRPPGARGLVRTRGAPGFEGRRAGNGGAVTRLLGAARLGRAPGRGRAVVNIDRGVTRMGLDAHVQRVRVEGVLELAADTDLTVDYSFWVAPGGVVRCRGCDLTIRAGSGVFIDGLVDLSGLPEDEHMDGGSLHIIEPANLVRHVQLPAIDARGGDGDVGPGGAGGEVRVFAQGDITVGHRDSNIPAGDVRRDDHVRQVGDWLVLPGQRASSPLLTSGGVGGGGRFAAQEGAGWPGGAGGDVRLSASQLLDPANAAALIAGRVVFYDGFLSTGLTPALPNHSPVSVYAFPPEPNVRHEENVHVGTGGLGGRGGRILSPQARRPGGDGGPGGAGGDLLVTAEGGVCPDIFGGGAEAMQVEGVDVHARQVGDVFALQGDRCALWWTTAGGSGGLAGGSPMHFTGNPGAQGVAGELRAE